MCPVSARTCERAPGISRTSRSRAAGTIPAGVDEHEVLDPFREGDGELGRDEAAHRVPGHRDRT